MKTLYQSLLFALGALALAGTAYAQVPSTNDTSDTSQNTGMGTGALGGPAAKNDGSGNTASGFFALASNTTGNANTAAGASALQSNTTGRSNTAIGVAALQASTTGNSNTASGDSALDNNTIGSSNTATGSAALLHNTTGNANTAAGYEALNANTSGDYNTASGFLALQANTTGQQNTASGVYALHNNTTGFYNTTSGVDALYNNTTGSSNIAEGYKAGFKLTTGSNNIDIGNLGLPAESGTIRIGTSATHKAAYVAGIYGTSVTGSAVMVNSDGQLGVTVSSERFKTAIAPMGSDTAKLNRLRPVSFRLKSDAKGTRQYGLIAEEVAKVYPELVIRDASGKIQGVRYDELAPMLLNEVQKITAQVENTAGREKQNAIQAAEIRDLKQQVAEMHAALLRLQAKDDRVAQR